MIKKITEFQEKVYEIVKKIPKGKITTYKAIALKLNSSPRAVGQALKRNPYAPRVPCHRVIMSNGERFRGRGKKIDWNNPCEIARLIGGYSGSNPKNIRKKIELLKKEGAI